MALEGIKYIYVKSYLFTLQVSMLQTELLLAYNHRPELHKCNYQKWDSWAY